MKVIEALSKNLRGTAQYHASAQATPAATLWPDKEREWLPVLGQLQAVLPELFCLGDYAPERRQGPAVWLKCVIARTLPEIVLPEGGHADSLSAGCQPSGFVGDCFLLD
ncbi:hypothetical protein KRX52_20195 [Pseudomonas sp. MAP12]|uniref:Uncharacterized protein n=1 Tax=Geopseudomonas aromaticivorans TaxID=2849492 RepID=A0ABS6N215_9GAMM|nr:hypothetical protein [Pseudomonas aromaticivorans]MBV2135098.1 hypothetical protein [Pseudomonas aromaticivorans]